MQNCCVWTVGCYLALSKEQSAGRALRPGEPWKQAEGRTPDTKHPRVRQHDLQRDESRKTEVRVVVSRVWSGE